MAEHGQATAKPRTDSVPKRPAALLLATDRLDEWRRPLTPTDDEAYKLALRAYNEQDAWNEAFRVASFETLLALWPSGQTTSGQRDLKPIVALAATWLLPLFVEDAPNADENQLRSARPDVARALSYEPDTLRKWRTLERAQDWLQPVEQPAPRLPRVYADGDDHPLFDVAGRFDPLVHGTKTLSAVNLLRAAADADPDINVALFTGLRVEEVRSLRELRPDVHARYVTEADAERVQQRTLGVYLRDGGLFAPAGALEAIANEHSRETNRLLNVLAGTRS